MKKKIIVTGSDGFLGPYCISQLLNHGYEIHALCYSSHLFFKSSNLYTYHCDIFNYAHIEELFKIIQPTHLLHLAWLVQSYFSLKQLSWIEATINLFKIFKKNGGKYALFTGSCREEPLNKNYATLYGISKKTTLEILELLAKSENINFGWARLFFIYGKFQPQNQLIPAVINSFLENKIFICMNGELIRDYSAAEDVAAALITILNTELSGIIPIASGVPHKIKYIIEHIAAYLNKSHLINYSTKNEKPEEPYIVGNPTRLYHETLWKPHYTLEKGLSETIEWFIKNKKSNNIIAPGF